jgi:probable phosphoglycerate mutase
MTAKLILVRHGETPSNIAKVLDTKLPGAPLTDNGIAQAKAFGARLAAVPRALCSSQALRARQTAAYIGEAVGVTPTSLDGLHEVQLGELDSTSGDENYRLMSEIFHAWHTGDLAVRPPGGESGREVLDRYIPVLERLRSEYLTPTGNGAGGDVLVVSHGAAIRLVAHYLTDMPQTFAENNHLDNTATVELAAMPAGGWNCLRWGRFEPPFPQVSPAADIPMG